MLGIVWTRFKGWLAGWLSCTWDRVAESDGKDTLHNAIYFP